MDIPHVRKRGRSKHSWTGEERSYKRDQWDYKPGYKLNETLTLKATQTTKNQVTPFTGKDEKEVEDFGLGEAPSSFIHEYLSLYGQRKNTFGIIMLYDIMSKFTAII